MPCVTRDDFLDAAADHNGSQFVQLVCTHHLKDDPFDLDELLSSLSRRQLEDLWNSLQHKCVSALLHFDDELEDKDLLSSADPSCHVTMLQSILTVAGSTIAINGVVIPQGLFETAVALHGIILSLPDGNEKLANSISSLCESWWLRELEGRNELISQTLVHLLQRCSAPHATNADIKRLWKIHLAMSIIDLDDEKSAPLKLLQQNAVASPSFLKSPEGRKCLAYFFTLNADMIDSLHSAMKLVIRKSNKTTLDWIGEVYYRAWNEATGPILEKIELRCIQDFMYCGVHAQKSFSPILHRLLSYFHKQKKQKGVDDMLQRLYDPIIWRSLMVANSSVRVNAASLLFDAFPLQSHLLGVEEAEELLRKQCEVFEQLLEDPSHAVRTIAALGICRVSAVYWEVIPAETIRTLIGVVVQKLAWDSSSADVRHAVIKGFTFMVDYRLTHSLLNSVLPKLCSLFHDKTEKVRMAVTELLIKVKSLRAMKFWQLVPVDHILARLEIDSPSIAIRLVDLLFSSYFPENKPLDVQFSRAVQLIKSNIGAARKFYLYAFNYTSTLNAVKFILFVLKCLVEVALKNQAQSSNTTDDQDSEVSNENDADVQTVDGISKNDVVAESQAGTTLDSSADMDIMAEDTDLVSGLLDCLVILWMGIQKSLSKTSEAELKKVLELRAAKQLPVILRYFEDSRVIGSLLMIAGFLPYASVPTVSCSIMSKLRALAQSDSTLSDYGPLLSTMCKWKKGNEVLELITEWLEPCISSPKLRTDRRASRAPRTVTFTDHSKPCVKQALNYVENLLADTSCRCVLLELNQPALRTLANSMIHITSKIEQRVRIEKALDEPLTDEILVKIFQRYLRLEVLLNKKEKPHDSAVAVLEHQLSWIDSHLIPCLSSVQETMPQRKRVRKLLTAADCTLMSSSTNETLLMSDVSVISPTVPSIQTKNFIKSVVEEVIMVSTEMLLVGISDNEMVSRVGDLAISLLQLDDGVSYLPVILPLMYRMAERYASFSSGCGLDEDEGVGCRNDPLPRVLCEVLKILSAFNQAQKVQAGKLLSEVRQSLIDVFNLFFRSAEIDSSAMVDVISTATAVLMTEMVNCVQQDCNFARQSSIKDWPHLSAIVVTVLMRQTKTSQMFLSEVELVSQSTVCDVMEGLVACMLIVSAVSSGKSDGVTIKKCLSELRLRMEQIIAAEVTLVDESPRRLLLQFGQELLKTCCDRWKLST